MSVLGYIKAFLGYVYEDKLGLAAFTVLAILLIFSLAGPLVYRVDPHAVHKGYGVKIYVVDPASLGVKGVLSLEVEALGGVLVSDGSLLLLGLNGVLYELPLPPLARGFQFEGEVRLDSSSLRVVAENVLLASVSHGSIYVVSMVDGAIAIDYIGNSSPTRLSVLSVGDTRALRGVVVGDGVIVLILESSIVLAGRGELYSFDVGFSLGGSGVSCWDKVVVGGSRGRLVVLNVSTAEVNVVRVFVDDVLHVACANGVVYVFGRGGSMAVVYENLSYKVIPTGVVDDLVVSIPFDGGLLTVGSMGSLLYVEGEGVRLAGYIGGLRGVRTASLSSGQLILVSFGEFVKDLRPPSLEHPLGTDYYGRDVLAQVMVGVRMSLFIAFITALIVTFIGATLGIVAGYLRGRVDSAVNSLINIMYSIPLEPFAVLLAIIMKPGMLTVILAISILIWRTTARIVRSQVLSVASTPMVEAAKAIGAPHHRIIAYYIVPAVLPVILVDFASTMVYAILAEATLSFIGVGPQDTFTLGTILNHARITGAWRTGWWLLTPGIFIGLITISLYILIRVFEPIANPKLRRT
jgi:ABC-type dipeptide/oligopeptide/nickel transport system permease subunit